MSLKRKRDDQELEDMITENEDILTPRTISDLVWCFLHEKEMEKLMGLSPELV